MLVVMVVKISPKTWLRRNGCEFAKSIDTKSPIKNCRKSDFKFVKLVSNLLLVLFLENRLNKCPFVRISRGVFIEGAVWTDSMTERDVDVGDHFQEAGVGLDLLN